MVDDDDGGLPEESQSKLEQENAVPVEAVGPYFRFDISTTQIFENIDDLYKYGTDIIYGISPSVRGFFAIFIVVDNQDVSDLLYPNQPHFWVAERLPPTPAASLEDPDFRGDVSFTPLYKKQLEWTEEGRTRGTNQPPQSIRVTTYKGVPVYLPDPTLDYSRPVSQTGDTTGATTGTTVRTTTTVTPGAAGGVTESETIPADVGLDAFGGAGATVTTASADPYAGFGPEGEFGGVSTATSSAGAGRGNGAAEVAQRRADAATANLTTANVATGTNPCLPNNPPASQGAGSGATPPATVPYDDAILRQARAAAAAPVSAVRNAANAASGAVRNAANAASGAVTNAVNAASTATNRAAAAAGATAPTTVTQPPSTPTSSATASLRPPNVYIYEPINPGFDRYDFNTGKKVYTPDNGPSRNTNSQPVVPQSTPRVSPAPIDGGIAAGTTTGGPSLLRQRQNISNRVGDVDQSGRIRGGL